MRVNSPRTLGLVLLLWLLATLTIGLQSWLGDQTIYAASLEQKREDFHYGILENKAPGGASWGAVGALSIQKRIGVVYLAEGIRKLTGISVGKIYKLLDSIFLFVSLVGLFFFLKRWLPDIYCLLGVLYFCAVLPLTYYFQLFHPWDRLQLALWIGLLYLVAERQFLFLALGLVVSMVVKFDTILLPFLYFLVHFDRARWQRTSSETVVLLVLGFGTYMVLGKLYPAPLDGSHFTWAGALAMLSGNAQKFASMNVRYPPLLVHALPVLLAVLPIGLKDRFVWSSVAFGLGLSLVYVLFTNYEEVRTHMVVLVLVLPSALISVRYFLENSGARIGKLEASAP